MRLLRYVSAPLLLDGTHKFDIRLYVLMCVLIVSNNGRNYSVAAPLQHTTSAVSLSASNCAIGPAGRSSGAPLLRSATVAAALQYHFEVCIRWDSL